MRDINLLQGGVPCIGSTMLMFRIQINLMKTHAPVKNKE